MKLLFIIKGIIKNKQKVIDNINSTFNDIDYTVCETVFPAHAIELAKKLSPKHTHVVAIGGDGTLNEVVNGILASGTLPSLAFYPSGTANDYSASVNCPDTLSELKESIKASRTIPIFLGKGYYKDIHGFDAERYFINIADIGIGGDVVQRVNDDKSNISAGLKFFKNIVITFFDFQSHNVKTIINNKELDEKMLSLVVAKGKYFGGRIGIAPHANPTKNELSIVKIGDISILEYLKKLPKLKRGETIVHKDLEYYTTSELEITTDIPSPIDMDGELVGYTPIKFETYNTPINFIVA